MKRNLFSKTFSQQRKQVFIIPALSLLFVLLFSSSTFAATSAQKDSISIKQNNVIFVSGNATIIGLENFSNTYIVSLERAETISTKSKVKTLAKTEDHSIAAQIIKKEKAAQVKIAKLQKQINKNAAVTFTLMPSSSDFDSTISRSTNFAIVSNHFHSQLKFLKQIRKLQILRITL